MTTWELVGGDVTIAGHLVLRPARPWSATVHALLAHLHASGLDCVPEPVGIRDGIEAVTYLEGDAGADALPHHVTDSAVRSAAELLRRVHDATTAFEPPVDAVWAFAPTPGARVVCHGDPAPWNFVWRAGVAVGLIDWDQASPAGSLDDVAYALDTFTPFRPDEVATGQHGFPTPPDRRARLRAFTSAYGIEDATGLVDRVVEREQQTVERVLALAEQRLEPWAGWVRQGYLDELRGRARWTRSHRHLLE